MKTLNHYSIRLILAFVFGFSVIGCELSSSPGTTTKEFKDLAFVSAEQTASLKLANGAKIELWTDEENVDKAVQVITSSKPTSEKNKEKVVERIYTVDCQECVGSIQSTMTLPIETEGLSEEELLQYHLAYKDDDTWVTLPSTVDVENRTVSGSVGHLTQFALIRWLSGNSLPEVSMRISPNLYHAMSGDYPDASVEVFATDKDGDPLRVEVTVALKSFQTKLVSEMVEFYKSNMNIFEASCHNAFGLTGGPSCTILRTALDVLKAPGYDWEITYDLSEVQPGYYSVPAVPISALDESFLYSVEEMKVIVRVFEGDAKKPAVEREQAAPWISGYIRSPEPVHPGPSADIYCPVQPTFNWNPGVYESMRLRLAEGDDVWGAAFHAAQWTCHGVGEDVDCNGDTPPAEGVFSSDWTPEKKLKDGKTYSWGIVVSLKPDDNKFDPTSSIRSDIYQFTVDSHILGSQCTPSKNAPTPMTTVEPISTDVTSSPAVDDPMITPTALQAGGEKCSLLDLTPEECANNGEHRFLVEYQESEGCYNQGDQVFTSNFQFVEGNLISSSSSGSNTFIKISDNTYELQKNGFVSRIIFDLQGYDGNWTSNNTTCYYRSTLEEYADRGKISEIAKKKKLIDDFDKILDALWVPGNNAVKECSVGGTGILRYCRIEPTGKEWTSPYGGMKKDQALIAAYLYETSEFAENAKSLHYFNCDPARDQFPGAPSGDFETDLTCGRYPLDRGYGNCTSDTSVNIYYQYGQVVIDAYFVSGGNGDICCPNDPGTCGVSDTWCCPGGWGLDQGDALFFINTIREWMLDFVNSHK